MDHVSSSSAIDLRSGGFQTTKHPSVPTDRSTALGVQPLGRVCGLCVRIIIHPLRHIVHVVLKDQ